ncbi:MAG: phosphopantothenoylcysteine decarboxylase [Phycisphaerales bacterium]|jgi:phosphopantothenoylcysteine decarboxylase / phosphopantothenate---cysteine ligase|nr:phosphopantothenoylcysteine decarboxylase [Phycisphaerales bacterium]
MKHAAWRGNRYLTPEGLLERPRPDLDPDTRPKSPSMAVHFTDCNSHVPQSPLTSSSGTPLRVLITAGPTWEPVDEVRFLGNRSSGRLGAQIAVAATQRGLPTTLLRGPATADPTPDPLLSEQRFHTASELDTALHLAWPNHDILIMAAAVADHRPIRDPDAPRKIRRSTGEFAIRTEPVPDLLEGLAKVPHGGTRIGFALEPADELARNAREKLQRKGLAAIVANPLETMDADVIDGVLIDADGHEQSPGEGPVEKAAFAVWLIDRVIDLHGRRRSAIDE